MILLWVVAPPGARPVGAVSSAVGRSLGGQGPRLVADSVRAVAGRTERVGEGVELAGAGLDLGEVVLAAAARELVGGRGDVDDGVEQRQLEVLEVRVRRVEQVLEEAAVGPAGAIHAPAGRVEQAGGPLRAAAQAHRVVEPLGGGGEASVGPGTVAGRAAGLQVPGGVEYRLG